MIIDWARTVRSNNCCFRWLFRYNGDTPNYTSCGVCRPTAAASVSVVDDIFDTPRVKRLYACSGTDHHDSRSISRVTWGTGASSWSVCGWWTRTADRGGTAKWAGRPHTTFYIGWCSSSSSRPCGFFDRMPRSRTPQESTRGTPSQDPCTCCCTPDSICSVV